MATAVPQQPYASIRRRVLSYSAEVFLLFAGVLILQGILFALRLNPLVRGMQSGAGLSKGVYHLWLLGTVTLPLVVYYAGTLASSAQATLVMRRLGLRLESVDGGRIGYGQAILRSLVMLIPFEVNHTFLVWASTPQGIPTQLVFQYAVVGILNLSIHSSGCAIEPAAERPRPGCGHGRCRRSQPEMTGMPPLGVV